MAGVQATDTCLEYVESTTTSLLDTGRTDGNGVLSFQHVCNFTTESGTNTTESTDSGRLTNVWYSTDDCDEEMVSYELAQGVCEASCTADGAFSRFLIRSIHFFSFFFFFSGVCPLLLLKVL